VNIHPDGVPSSGRRLGGLGSAAVVAAGLAAIQAGPGVTAIGAFRRRFMPRLAGRGLADHVALTFDDGPDPATTPLFLEELRDRGVRATFFLVGSMAARAPGLVAEIVAAGHEVGVHGWDHRYLSLRGPAATYHDLARAASLLESAACTAPWLFRPPYGVLTSAAIVVAHRLELTPVLWTTWGREWRPGATPELVSQTLLQDLAGGATVLLHDSDATAPAGSARAALGALPALFDACAAMNLQVGPLSEHGERWQRPQGPPARARHSSPG
jgi:peptidoglycan/xylan/chitin deacetylase (PgdA/CDA1 family)